MLHVETFKAYSEDDLSNQINYFLKQIDENMIKEIKFSSFAFSIEKEYQIIYTALIIYYVR
ncbi:MAG: sporulation protein Cse60 [Erysipelotrichaceae bacterium]|nr:sporulation protein Cse60 [Erysipelotrichaceae bacterium]